MNYNSLYSMISSLYLGLEFYVFCLSLVFNYSYLMWSNTGEVVEFIIVFLWGTHGSIYFLWGTHGSINFCGERSAQSIFVGNAWLNLYFVRNARLNLFLWGTHGSIYFFVLSFVNHCVSCSPFFALVLPVLRNILITPLASSNYFQ
jgi:hypothetical protein